MALVTRTKVVGLLLECWFDHFVETVRPSHRTEKVLLIIDGHSSHTKNMKVTDKARDNNTEAQIWLRQHPGRSVTEFQIATLFGSAHTNAATVSNAVGGFRKCGINPFNPHIFSDDDFVAADVTDKPDPAADLPHLQQNNMSAGDLSDPQRNATSAGNLPNPQTNVMSSGDLPDPQPNATSACDLPGPQLNATSAGGQT